MKGYWTCTRQTDGIKCRRVNPNKLRKCAACRKPRPPRKRPAHLAALDLTYEQYVEINGGDHCGVCGRERTANRKLDRDHEHKADGRARGLLCWRHNKGLQMFDDDPVLLEAAVAYLKRSEAA